jgi:aspartate carbamoyltransferase catalytic subunit|tara:strand:- start:692 stop:1639 length:948 start_codon:yes stop_codon:yes gene_type:complete
MTENHIRGIDDLGKSGIEEILALSDHFHEVSTRRIPKVPALRGKTIALLFYEDSTRTRLSFETASKRLSADSLNFSIGSSSVKKGESLRDTIETISAMGVDAIVVRHGSAGVPWMLPRWTDAAVINAGDGSHEHPTQALLDCYTIRKNLGELNGKRIAIVGDIKHSRVARSNVKAFLALGASVTLVGPKTLMPFNTDDWGVETTDQFDSVIGDSDVLYMLRMQLERQQKSFVPSLREYAKEYGLSDSRAQSMKPESLIMHPGPMNRGVEVSSNIKEHPKSVVNNQVANGVIIRMSALYYLLGAGSITKLEGFNDE